MGAGYNRTLMNLVWSKRFTVADQVSFAELSLDRNPIHLDPIAARRTQAGAPVVYGMLLLCWTLDAILERMGCEEFQSVNARFSSFVFVGEIAELFAVDQGETVRAEVRVDGGVRSRIVIRKGKRGPGRSRQVDEFSELKEFPQLPVDQDIDDLAVSTAAYSVETPAGLAEKLFPFASKALGPTQITGIALASGVVGMVCPGLHSLFAEAAFTFAQKTEGGPALVTSVKEVDPRFRMVKIEIESAGLVGTLKAFVRVPPVAQRSMEHLSSMVQPKEFDGQTVLVVGGSRGLGELTAKLIALGGGHAAITYVVGKQDAESVAAEIQAFGGSASVHPYDVRQDAALQLDAMGIPFTHAYYFATSMIGRPRSTAYMPELMAEFIELYVNGFWRLAHAMRAISPQVSLFYPSTVFVDSRPAGLIEYAMAKAAGELLCGEINETLSPTRALVARLPRMPTDQTATITAVDTESAEDVMVPLIREMQTGARTAG